MKQRKLSIKSEKREAEAKAESEKLSVREFELPEEKSPEIEKNSPDVVSLKKEDSFVQDDS